MLKRVLVIFTIMCLALVSLQSEAPAKRGRGGGYYNPCAATPTYCITPEGATIEIYPEVTDWTTAQVYSLLKPNAYQLSLIGPNLKIRVQTQWSTSASISTGTSGSVWTNFKAVIYLRPNYIDPTTGEPRYQAFSTAPDSTIAHEYGHVWTLYHLYLTQQKDWTKWIAFRWPDGAPVELDTSYGWMKSEIIADDYRLLFGTYNAISQMGFIQRNTTDPRDIPGYKEWFMTVWANQP